MEIMNKIGSYLCKCVPEPEVVQVNVKTVEVYKDGNGMLHETLKDYLAAEERIANANRILQIHAQRDKIENWLRVQVVQIVSLVENLKSYLIR